MAEVKQRKAAAAAASHGKSSLISHRIVFDQNPLIKSDAAVAILSKKADATVSLACPLPWGHGWGWATLPNGVWSGGIYFNGEWG